MNIDPGVVSLIQSTFLEQIKFAFATTATYAFNLLYLFAALEVAIFGIIWALQRNVGWEKLIFKIIKIGVIFFVIENYTSLINVILESFAQLAGAVVDENSVADYVFNPAKIWQYGYDAGINLLKMTTETELFGLSMILVTLGMGILLVFGLLGIQMIVQIVGFYVVSFGALILIPFGALTASRNMFDRAIQAVLQAGLRLMVLILIIGIAVFIWEEYDFTNLETTTDFNLNQPMGLFFTGLLFLCLAIYLPKIVSTAVGDLSKAFIDSSSGAPAPAAGPISITTPETSAAVSNVQAATTVAPGEASSGYGAAGSIVSASTVPTASTLSTGGSAINSGATKQALSQASKISRSISEGTIKKIKDIVSQSAKE